jgi:hypothetical protein
LFGHELRDSSFIALWSPEAQPGISKLVRGVIEDCIGVVAGITGSNVEGQVLPLELLLLPLTCRDGERARVIGVLSAQQAPYWLAIRPVLTLQSGDFRFVGPAVDHPKRRFVAGRDNRLRGPGFVVYPASPPPRIPRNVQG